MEPPKFTPGSEPATSLPPHSRSPECWLLSPCHEQDTHLNRQSAQRELNPRFRHGKAVGYRYIMGAWC